MVKVCSFLQLHFSKMKIKGRWGKVFGNLNRNLGENMDKTKIFNSFFNVSTIQTFFYLSILYDPEWDLIIFISIKRSKVSKDNFILLGKIKRSCFLWIRGITKGTLRLIKTHSSLQLQNRDTIFSFKVLE